MLRERAADAANVVKSSDGVLVDLIRVSASQVETFRSCPRKWFNGSVLKERAPQSPSQARGEEVHAQIEPYLLTGQIDAASPHAPLVEVARQFLPAPGKGLLVEHEFRMPTFEGGPEFLGYIDLADPRGSVLRIYDHKTTSDFRYAKTPAELCESVQMMAYAQWGFSVLETFGIDKADVVEVAHVYLRTRGKPKAHFVSTVVSREHVEGQWQKILATVREMQGWAQKHPKTADDLPPNTDACGMYGGCYYRPKCGFLPIASVGVHRIEGTLAERNAKRFNEGEQKGSEVSMGLMDRLNAMNAGAGGGVKKEIQVTIDGKPVDLDNLPPSPAPSPPPAAKAPAERCPSGVFEGETPKRCLGVRGHDGPCQYTAVSAFAALCSATGTSTTPKGVVLKFGCAKLEGHEEECALSRKIEAAQIAPTQEAVATAFGIIPPDAPPRDAIPAAAAPAEEPKKRGRKPKAETPVLPVAVASEAEAAAVGQKISSPAPMPAAPTMQAFTDGAQAPLPNGHIEALYVDCMPVKGGEGPHVLLEDWMREPFEQAAAANGVLDYRMIPYTSKGVLATTFKQKIAKGLPSVIVASSYIPGTDVALECLIPFARKVVRGLRG